MRAASWSTVHTREVIPGPQRVCAELGSAGDMNHVTLAQLPLKV